MTETKWPIGNTSPAMVGVLGQLSLAGWHVEHALLTVGRGLAVEVAANQHQQAVRSIKTVLSDHGVPAWARVDASVVTSWLDRAETCLTERDALVAASATSSVGDVSHRWSFGADEPERVEVTAEDVAALVERCGQLVFDADVVVAGLGMLRADGGRQYGFRDIARTLYLQAVEPDLLRGGHAETAPAVPPA